MVLHSGRTSDLRFLGCDFNLHSTIPFFNSLGQATYHKCASLNQVVCDIQIHDPRLGVDHLQPGGMVFICGQTFFDSQLKHIIFSTFHKNNLFSIFAIYFYLIFEHTYLNFGGITKERIIYVLWYHYLHIYIDFAP